MNPANRATTGFIEPASGAKSNYNPAIMKMTSLKAALQHGDAKHVSRLIEGGADVHYVRGDGYNAMIDAACGRDAYRNQNLLRIFELLISRGVDPNAVSFYSESALRVLSRIGRFDAVGLLLDAGADESQLSWSPLLRAVALGSIAEIRDLIAAGESLESRDYWERTPWLIAVQTGQTGKALCLEEYGADMEARGRCNKASLHYAVRCGQLAMLRRLLQLGIEVDLTDEFGATALCDAVDADDLACVETLIDFGADVHVDHCGSLLGNAASEAVAARLLEGGADPRHLPVDIRRGRVGLAPVRCREPIECTAADFANDRTRRFGRDNPEEMNLPFWIAMIRSGAGASRATCQFKGPSSLDEGPVWCAERLGQSFTRLEDGRTIEIGGEHEDHYDSDFCIYNDVFVHEPDGSIRIFGYPKHVFPPTDFHTATLIGDSIYIVGSLGYRRDRDYGKTAVFRLDTSTFRIERLATSGDGPGWIHEHRAELLSTHRIAVREGKILTHDGRRETLTDNPHIFELDVNTLVWRRA